VPCRGTRTRLQASGALDRSNPRTLERMRNWSKRAKRRLGSSCALALAPLAVGIAACGTGQGNPLASSPYDASGQVALNAGADGATVDSSRPLRVRATGDEGRITDVTAVDGAGRYLAGRLSPDGARWHSTAPLAAGDRYTVRISTEDSDGRPGRRTLTFATRPADARRLAVHFGPDPGTYGVAQPLTAELSHRVTDPRQRRIVEGALRVSSSPEVSGSWYWVDSKELHFRPRHYWPAHAEIRVGAALEGRKIRQGLMGGPVKPLTLHTGARTEVLADAKSDTMTVRRDGRALKKLPITTGKPGYRTRRGTKVVLGKEAYVRMRSETVNIGGGESYNLGVHWATRLTWSGEYIHAAPWSVGSQGVSNVSHGCTGVSMGNGEWIFDRLRPGDPVTHTGTGGKKMPAFGNGFGDWNLSWARWQKGSALGGSHGAASGGGTQQAEAARLRPGL
jgi:lipoprotein-anchoring transpeptidase ErfK/SrfK